MTNRAEEVDDRVEPKDHGKLYPVPVPERGILKPRAIGVADENFALADEYDRLAVQLMTAAVKTRFKKIMVASAKEGEGRTTVVLNLAAALQRAGQRVLVVDCDFARPAVGRVLEMEMDLCFTDLVEHGIRTDFSVLRSGKWGFTALPLREKMMNPVQLLTSAGFNEMLRVLAERYDFVLFDSSPMLETAHWQLVAQVVDKMLLVVRPGATSVGEMGQAVRQLTQSDIVGVVLNQVAADR
jgi:capsular exopolysaccharide synthesis family protein